MQNIDFELPVSIQCVNCGRVVEKSPMFSRILAKYLGFCYECIQNYENKHNSTLEQEKVQLAEYLKDGVEKLCNQLIDDLFPTFLMQKAFQQYLKDKYPFGTIDSYALIMEKNKFYGSNFEKDMQEEANRLLNLISKFIYTLMTKYNSNIEKLKISKNEFYNEGLNLGLKIFHIMLANQSLNTNSFNRGQILNNLGETVFIFESVICGFIDKGLSIIMNNANGLAEKRKVYCTMIGVISNIYGQIKGMLNSNPSGK